MYWFSQKVVLLYYTTIRKQVSPTGRSCRSGRDVAGITDKHSSSKKAAAVASNERSGSKKAAVLDSTQQGRGTGESVERAIGLEERRWWR